MSRLSITAGLVMRRAVRRYLLEEGVSFTEAKTLLESTFFLDVTKEQENRIFRHLNAFREES